jgi:hypothetical protein
MMHACYVVSITVITTLLITIKNGCQRIFTRWKVYTVTNFYFFLQNVLGKEGIGFKIAMGAFDKTRPPVSTLLNYHNRFGKIN